MDIVFLLEHVARRDTDEEDVKTIGVFSSELSAKSAISELIKKNGFREYPDSFIISKKRIDQIHWEEGFGI